MYGPSGAFVFSETRSIDDPVRDTQFYIRPALAQSVNPAHPLGYSFESVAFPGFYIYMRYNKLYLKLKDTSADFKERASFLVLPAVVPGSPMNKLSIAAMFHSDMYMVDDTYFSRMETRMISLDTSKLDLSVARDAVLMITL